MIKFLKKFLIYLRWFCIYFVYFIICSRIFESSETDCFILALLVGAIPCGITLIDDLNEYDKR